MVRSQAADFKYESKFEPLQVIWQSLRTLFQKVIEGLERAKSTAKLVGPLYGAAWAGRTGEHKHRVCLNWTRPAATLLQSLLAATGSLEENMLPLLRC